MAANEDKAAIIKHVEVDVDYPEIPKHRSTWRLLLCNIAAVGVLVSGSAVAVYFAIGAPRDAMLHVTWASDHYKQNHSLGLGFVQPSYVSPNGRHATQNITVLSPRNGTVTLVYNATLHEGVHYTAIDYDETIVSAHCTSGANLHLTYASATLASDAATTFTNSSLVTGSHSWGCAPAHLSPNASSTPHTIMYRVLAVVGVSGVTVTLQITTASFGDFFEHLSVHYADTPAPPTDPAQPVSAEPSRRRKLSLWDTLCSGVSDVSQAVTHPISTLHKAADAVVTGITDVTQMDLDISPTNHIIEKYSWPPAGTTMTDGDIDFSSTGASLDLGITFGLDLEHAQLQSAELLVTGQVDLTAGASLSSSDAVTKNIPLVTNYALGNADFAVCGVPFHAAASFDLELRVVADAGATMSASIGAVGTAELGVTYTNGAWVRKSSRTWSYKKIMPTLHASTREQVTLSLVPTAKLEFDWIGGPRAAVLPYVSALADMSSSGTCSASLGYGLNVGVGGNVNLKDPFTGDSLGSWAKKTWPLSLVYQSPLST